MLKGLAGKVVVITGAAAGIGRATALRFAEERAIVVAWDVAETDGTLVDDIRAADGTGEYHRVDVADKARVEAAVAHCVATHGRIDVLINNAGIVRDAQLAKWKDGELLSTMTDEQWDAVVDVNLKGVFLATRAVVPHMIRQGGGVILSASSVVGLYGNFGQTNYVAAKAGVIGMTRGWARELGRYRIRVNAVAPGFIGTDMVRGMPAKVQDDIAAHTPIGRMGEPRDVANVYAWLASDEAGFVHGATISVDGGLVLGT